jgi:predicted amidohydrolase
MSSDEVVWSEDDQRRYQRAFAIDLSLMEESRRKMFAKGAQLIETVAAWSTSPDADFAKGISREWKARIKARLVGESRRES